MQRKRTNHPCGEEHISVCLNGSTQRFQITPGWMRLESVRTTLILFPRVATHIFQDPLKTLTPTKQSHTRATSQSRISSPISNFRKCKS